MPRGGDHTENHQNSFCARLRLYCSDLVVCHSCGGGLISCWCAGSCSASRPQQQQEGGERAPPPPPSSLTSSWSASAVPYSWISRAVPPTTPPTGQPLALAPTLAPSQPGRSASFNANASISILVRHEFMPTKCDDCL